jgi:hypothetical protein
MKALERLAHVAGVVALVLAAARAGDQTQRTAKTGVEVRAWSPWPNQLNKGWAPMFVELQNQSSEARWVRLEARAQDYYINRSIEDALWLQAGESAHLELHCPSNGMWNTNTFMLDVRVEGDHNVLGAIVASGASNDFRSVLAVAPRAAAASDVQRWIESTSTKSVGGYYTSGTPSASTNDNVQIGYATFGELPTSPAAYTSLDLVAIDASEGLPPASELGAVLAWVRGGGELLLTGSNALDAARADAQIAPWLENRFEAVPNEVFACGLGRISVSPEDGFFESEVVRALVATLAQANTCVVPRQGAGFRSRCVAPTIPGIGEVPYRVFALLLIVFAIVIGPVNFIWVRRARRPVLLLVTIPAIAMLTSGMLLAYGVFFQGLEVKTASNSMALLDQREHRSACVEHRMLYAGLAPGEGLRPQPGTSVHAVGYGFSSSVGVRDRLRLVARREEGTLLTSDYLPTRAPVVQVLCSERAERARLDVERNGESYEVVNNLGARLERLVLRDTKGDYYALESALEAGDRAALAQGVEWERFLQSADLLRDPLEVSKVLDLMASGPMLPPATYAARLASSPFRDDCGVESVELAGEHTLYGVLPLDLEAWR